MENTHAHTSNGRNVMTNRSEIVTNFYVVAVVDARQFCAFVGSTGIPYCNITNNSKQYNRMKISFLFTQSIMDILLSTA